MGFNPRPLFDKIPVGREIFLDDLIVYPRKRRGRIRNFANQYIGLSSTGTAKSPRRKEAEDDKTESFGVRVSPRSCPSVFRFSQVTWQAEALLFRETKLYWISILESLLVKLIFTSTGFSTSYQYLKLALLMLCVAAQSGRSNHPKMPIFLIALFFFFAIIPNLRLNFHLLCLIFAKLLFSYGYLFNRNCISIDPVRQSHSSAIAVPLRASGRNGERQFVGSGLRRRSRRAMPHAASERIYSHRPQCRGYCRPAKTIPARKIYLRFVSAAPPF